MALLQIDAGAHLRPDDALLRALDVVPAGAPVTALIHGYKFRAGDPARDPHVQLYGAPARPGALRCADWPGALGFSADGVADGLCLGFGWDACARHLPSLARHRRNGFAVAYARAEEAGARLADLIAVIAGRRPDLAVDLFAHSLGARVALRALCAPGVGRAVLLGAAEDAGVAAARLAQAAPEAEVHHIAARHNDMFDVLFEAAAPRNAGRRAVALGRAGLPAPRAAWIDLQIDAPELCGWLGRRGVPLAPVAPAVCHWSFYARPGAMTLYRSILRDREAWSVAALRRAGAPEGLSPRWSRLAPAAPRGFSFAGRGAGGLVRRLDPAEDGAVTAEAA